MTRWWKIKANRFQCLEVNKPLSKPLTSIGTSQWNYIVHQMVLENMLPVTWDLRTIPCLMTRVIFWSLQTSTSIREVLWNKIHFISSADSWVKILMIIKNGSKLLKLKEDDKRYASLYTAHTNTDMWRHTIYTYRELVRSLNLCCKSLVCVWGGSGVWLWSNHGQH